MKKFIKQLEQISPKVSVYTDFTSSLELPKLLGEDLDDKGIYLFDPESRVLVYKNSLEENLYSISNKYINIEKASIRVVGNITTDPLLGEEYEFIYCVYDGIDEISVNIKPNTIIILTTDEDFEDEILEILREYKKDSAILTTADCDGHSSMDLEIPKKSLELEEIPTKKVFPF